RLLHHGPRASGRSTRRQPHEHHGRRHQLPRYRSNHPGLMPVTVDAGDTSQGLRRAFGLTGRIPLALDETAVPTALTRDASSPPYASEPRYCMASAICQGTAGTFGTLTIENNTFKVGDNAAGVVAVIDNVEFSTQEGATRQHQIWLARRSINLGLSL